MRLLSFFLQCALLVSSVTVSAQTTEVFSSFFGITGSVQWFKHALDASGSGDVVVTGFSDGTIGIPGQNPALSSGSNDWFVARYNAAGNLLWFRKIGGTQNDYGITITTDGQGNTYVGGKSNSNLDAGVNSNNWDPFVAKYDINGTQLWIRNVASSISPKNEGDSTGISQLVVDGNSIYMVCRTENTRLTISRWDREVTKMEWPQQVIQLTSTVSTPYISVADATVDSNHNLIIVGARYYAHIETPAAAPRVPRSQSQGGWDGFALGFSATGEWVMTTGQGTPGDDMTLGVTVDAANNIYVTGYVTGNYDGELWRNRGGAPDVFITKYGPITKDGQGARLWSRVFYPAAATDATLSLRGIRLAVDYVGGLYLAASEQSFQVWSNPFDYFDLPSNNDLKQGLVLQKFDTNGNSVWGQRLSMADMNVAGFSFDNTGSLYISGSFSGNWASQTIGQGSVYGFLQKRSNPLNCSCSDLSTLVDEVASLLQISVN